MSFDPNTWFLDIFIKQYIGNYGSRISINQNNSCLPNNRVSTGIKLNTSRLPNNQVSMRINRILLVYQIIKWAHENLWSTYITIVENKRNQTMQLFSSWQLMWIKTTSFCKYKWCLFFWPKPSFWALGKVLCRECMAASPDLKSGAPIIAQSYTKFGTESNFLLNLICFFCSLLFILVSFYLNSKAHST